MLRKTPPSLLRSNPQDWHDFRRYQLGSVHLAFLELETNMSNDAPHLPHGHREDRPYWKRAHQDWRFWFGLTAMLVAISFYVVTNNLSTARTGLPRNLPPAVSRVP